MDVRGRSQRVGARPPALSSEPGMQAGRGWFGCRGRASLGLLTTRAEGHSGASTGREWYHGRPWPERPVKAAAATCARAASSGAARGDSTFFHRLCVRSVVARASRQLVRCASSRPGRPAFPPRPAQGRPPCSCSRHFTAPNITFSSASLRAAAPHVTLLYARVHFGSSQRTRGATPVSVNYGKQTSSLSL